MHMHILNLDCSMLIQRCLIFSTDEPFHLSYDIVGQVEGFICKKMRDRWMSIGWSRFKICICTQQRFHVHMIYSPYT
jgi:hypothetical protein